MKIIHQKNVYYVDVNKNVYRGYVETSLSRENNEGFVVYKSAHLEIADVVLLGSKRKLSFEYFNSKMSKEKAKANKMPKVIIKTKQPSFRYENGVCEKQQSNNEEKCSEQSEKEVGLETRFSMSASSCCDSIRIKIPDDVTDPNLKIRIEFQPEKDNPSIIWYRPVFEKDKHKEMVASNTDMNSSCIAPYIDSITYVEMYYIIPNTEEVKVVSSGTFKSIKEEDKTIIYLYAIQTHPKYLMFSVGTYDQCDIFNDSDKRKLFTPYSIETDKTDIINDLQALIKYIESFTKTQELSTCNILFTLIDTEDLVAKNMIVIKYCYVPSPKDIEMAYLLKRILAECLSRQIYYFMNWCVYDAWIYMGFSGYLSDYSIRYLLGNNEFLCAYFDDKQYVLENDVVEYPLFYTARKESKYNTEFFVKKSRLVFHCMEAHLSFAFIQKISDELIKVRSISPEGERDESPQTKARIGTDVLNPTSLADLRKCFTPMFIKIVKDSTGKDLRGFFDFYVFRPGLIKVKLAVQVNKKKNSASVQASCSATSMLQGANKRVQGNIEIKSFELEGSFDHEVTFEDENVFMYHTRTKKKKKEDEEEVMPLLYIRADTRRQDLFDYIVEQPDYMQIEQLQDKSVIGQLEAINCLRIKPSLASCEALEKMLDNSHVFYKVRIRAMYALRFINIEEYNGFQRAIQYFIRNRCVPNSTVLKSNEFGLIPYFIQKHLIRSISQIDLSANDLISDSKIVIAFLENILKLNDNSLSQFEDSWYISTAINQFMMRCTFLMCYNTPKSETERIYREITEGVGLQYDPDGFVGSLSTSGSRVAQSEVKRPSDSELIAKCINELERFRVSDMVFPSNNNIVTRICLVSYIRLAFYNKIILHRKSLENLAMYPNLFSIRIPAIEGVLILFSDSLPFLLKMAREEVSFMAYHILSTILRVMLLDLRVHFLDTDEYEVRLTEKLTQELLQNEAVLLEIHRIHFTNHKIADLIKKLLLVIDGHFTDHKSHKEHIIQGYDPGKEDNVRQNLLKLPSTSRRLKISSMISLKIAAFEETLCLKLPRIKNFKPKALKEPVPVNLKIRIKPARFLVKNAGNFNIRFKIRKDIISKDDVPVIIVGRYRENKTIRMIDEYVTRSKSTGFFPWEPRTSDQILELVRENRLDGIQTFRELEKALIFTLSYNLITSKVYQTAKSLYGILEQIYFSYAFICKEISPMTPEARKRCEDCLEELKANPAYVAFCYPVDTSELKNYLDVVRVPISFNDIYLNVHNYKSLDAFVCHLERIYTNCLNYNDFRSLIAESAMKLKKDVDLFKSALPTEKRPSLDVLREIFESCNVEGLLDTLIDSTAKLRTWGDVEEQLLSLKRMYSRSSNSGKILVGVIRNIREQLKNWFLYDGMRVLMDR